MKDHSLSEFIVIPKNSRGIQDQPVIHIANIKEYIKSIKTELDNDYFDTEIEDWEDFCLRISCKINKLVGRELIDASSTKNEIKEKS